MFENKWVLYWENHWQYWVVWKSLSIILIYIFTVFDIVREFENYKVLLPRNAMSSITEPLFSLVLSFWYCSEVFMLLPIDNNKNIKYTDWILVTISKEFRCEFFNFYCVYNCSLKYLVELRFQWLIADGKPDTYYNFDKI